jgi:hypothetical protein
VIQYCRKFINHNGDNMMPLNDPSVAQSPETNPGRERNTLNRLRDSTAAKITAGTLTVVAGLGIANIFSGPESATVIEVTELDIDNDGIADVRTTTEVLGGETTDEAIEQELTAPETSEVIDADILNPDLFINDTAFKERVNEILNRKNDNPEEIDPGELNTLMFRGYVVSGQENFYGDVTWVVLKNPIGMTFEGGSIYFGATNELNGQFAGVQVGQEYEKGIAWRDSTEVVTSSAGQDGSIQYFANPEDPESGVQIGATPHDFGPRGLLSSQNVFKYVLTGELETIVSSTRFFTDHEEVKAMVGRELDFNNPEDYKSILRFNDAVSEAESNN